MDARAYDGWAQQIAGGDWLGEEAFYQAPAYPYLLAVIYWFFGHDLDLAHLIMMGIGAAACGVLVLTTRVLFGFGAAVSAGVLIAFYPPAIFFDGLIGKASLGLLLISVMLLLLLTAQAPRWIISYQRFPVASASNLGSPSKRRGKKPMLSEWSATTMKSSGRDSLTGSPVDDTTSSPRPKR